MVEFHTGARARHAERLEYSSATASAEYETEFCEALGKAIPQHHGVRIWTENEIPKSRKSLETAKTPPGSPRDGHLGPPRRPPRTPPRKPNGKAQRPGNPRTPNGPREHNQPPGRAAEAPKAPETRFRARAPNARNRHVNGRTPAPPGPLCADATPGRPLSPAEPNAHIYTPTRAI
jgi:hypothetical protein